MLAYLKLYRIDAALITLFAALFGFYLHEGSITFDNILIALFISLVPVNYIYSYNSWSDNKIDQINKPHRPIPSGEISEKNALIYSRILLIVSLTIPFFIYKNYLQLFLFLFLPFLGLLYSHKSIKLKNFMLFSVITTSFILVSPMLIGYFSGFDITVDSNFNFVLGMIIFCFGVIPLKDIEDEEGDVAHKVQNWKHILGANKLILFSLFFLIVGTFHFTLAQLDLEIKIMAISIFASTSFLLLMFSIFKFPLDKLYKTIIYMIILLALFLGIIKFIVL